MRENRVGDKVPSPEEGEKLLAALRSVREGIKEWGILVSEEQRKKWEHPREGYEPHLATVLSLSRKHSVKVRDTTPEQIEADERITKTATALTAENEIIASLLEDTYGQARSELASGFRAYYSELKAKAKNDPEIASELKPVTEFMAEPAKKAQATRRSQQQSTPPA